MRVISALTLAGILAFFAYAETFAADGTGRVALVIGNAKYPDSDSILKDAANDSQDIADELRHDNFYVEIGVNLTGDAIRQPHVLPDPARCPDLGIDRDQVGLAATAKTITACL